jgi:hypothetical protein
MAKVENILSDVEKLRLQDFLNDQILVEAVRKVLLFGIYYNGTLKSGQEADSQMNFALGLVAAKADISNEELGADLRACAEGIRMVETGFKQLEKFKEIKNDKPEEKNPAR